MDEYQFTLEQLASRTGTHPMDKQVRNCLLSLPRAERVDFLKRLWPMNYQYTLVLIQAAQLSRQENEHLLRYWLRLGQHNVAEKLIQRMEPILGEKKFWQIASEEKLSSAMRDLMNYHSHGRLDLLLSRE
ncbi:hypothetical protein [Pseudomonas sp. T8]|uniref:hypothetical protein n=1 Tax=Pseudomonas sp. T8 TaxID=645292 RepID=UPI0021493663|nr:hypothetical protein [Pseudomonas sp. T8]UUT23495.1 hypothetical protein NRG23_05900 [Pseudomonas sp. T8]